MLKNNKKEIINDYINLLHKKKSNKEIIWDYTKYFKRDKKNKYNNKKIIYNNIKFDSLKELERYKGLEILEKNGIIFDLKVHPKYLLQEGFCYGKGKQRPIYYIADFSYTENDKNIVEDVKGKKTEVYNLKKKLFLYKYPDIIFKEI